MLEIDISGSYHENDGDDLLKIKLRSQNIVQFNFSKFLFRSKSVCEKCSEIMKSIEREIVEIEHKYEIEEEIIKEFIEIIEEDKVFIPIEHYKDIYTLSKHFCIDKLTNLLDEMMSKLLVNDLNFSIQILLDYESTEDKKEENTELVNKIEKFLKTRVNECMKNNKFKELPIPTIYRIIESAISNDRETVDINILFKFIVESAMNRFILFKFVELHRLNKDNIDEFIKFIDLQDEKSKQIYLEYIPFNYLLFKEMKHNYDELSNNFNQIQEELKRTKNKMKKNQKESDKKKKESEQTKEELKQAKEELKQIKEELEQTKEELKQKQEESEQKKEELKQTKEELKQTKEELKQKQEELEQTNKPAHTIMVSGNDRYNQLGEKPNKYYDDCPVIHPPQKMSIDPSSLLSFSIYCTHLVKLTRGGKLLGIGDNRSGQICDSLPKKEITEFTEFSIRNWIGSKLDPISAVCSLYGTLYMFSSGSKRQLVLCDKEIKGGHPVFLDIGDECLVSLFGGSSHSAAISNKGEVIFINRDAMKESPYSNIRSVSLPDGEKAVSVACCEDSVVALSSKGRVFLSAVQKESNVLNFSIVQELSDQEIIWVSGKCEYFLAVSKEGRVFGCGSNIYGQLGLGQEISKVSSFTEILSLKNHKIRAAYAGWRHSLFETREGKILACGNNYFSQLLLNSNSRETVYSPIETIITNSNAFCIAGSSLSIAFIGGDPPPNTPNKLIEKFE